MKRLRAWVHGLQHRRDRLMEALASALLTMGAVWWLMASDVDALERLEQEVLALAQQQEPALAAVLPKHHSSDAFKPQDWPSQADSVALWAAVQHGLEACGLEVQVLQPQASGHREGLPEQAVALRLLGPWSSWRTCEQALAEQAPWWLVQQLQVLPTGQRPDEVSIELQARIGWRPEHWASAGPWQWRFLPPGQSLSAATLPLFGTGEGVENLATSVVSGQNAGTSAMRLLGVWQQDGRFHALLDLGIEQVYATAGQRLSRSAYRVRHVGPDSVDLTGVLPGEPSLRLRLREEP